MEMMYIHFDQITPKKNNKRTETKQRTSETKPTTKTIHQNNLTRC
jgi:hypothetical protein